MARTVTMHAAAPEARAGEEPRPCAVGVLTPDRTWVGFLRLRGGYRLVFGSAGGAIISSAAKGAARRLELFAVAWAYFVEALDGPPPELEATQADLAQLLRWLADTEAEAHTRANLAAAVDAVDDGLAGDVVAARLADGAGAWSPRGRADPVDLLAGRYAALRALGTGARPPEG